MAVWSHSVCRFYGSSAADFKVFVQGISTNLAKSELVKTTDTGQVDWNTITTIPGVGFANATMYEMYRFNDALQATNPCFIKFQYGRDVDSRFTLYISLGVGTNGAGVLTSPVGPLAVMPVGNDSNTDKITLWTSGPGYLGACFGVVGNTGVNQTNSGAWGMRFFIERTLDASMVVDPRGVICHGNHRGHTTCGTLLGFGGTPSLVDPQAMSLPFPAFTSGTYTDRTAWVGGKFQPRPMLLAHRGIGWLTTGFLYCIPTDLNSAALPSIKIGTTSYPYYPLWETYNNGESVNEANMTCNAFGNGLYSGVMMRG